MKWIHLLLCICPVAGLGQTAPGIEWQRTLGSSGYEIARSIAPTADGGCIVSGFTDTADGDVDSIYGGNDIWVVKLDSNGNTQWTTNLGGSDFEDARSILPVGDTGYILTGYTLSDDVDVSGNNGQYDGWIAYMDTVGNLLWQECIGGSDFEDMWHISDAIGTENGYMLAGTTSSSDGDVTEHKGNRDLWVVKTFSDGTLHWQRSLGGSNLDKGYYVAPTPDENYIILGYTESSDGDVTGYKGSGDIWVIKMDPNTGVIWSKTYGGSDWEDAFSIIPTADNGFIFAGRTESSDGDVTANYGGVDGWIVKIDALGNIEWQKNYGGVGYDAFYSIVPAPENTYIVGGYTDSPDGDVSDTYGSGDFWIVKIDLSGNIIWEKTYGGSGLDLVEDICIANDGSIIAAGMTASTDNDVSGFHGGISDFWVIKLGEESLSVTDNTSDNQLYLYPNPTDGLLYIKSEQPATEASVFDLLGRNVLHIQEQDITSVDMDSLSKGSYYIRLKSGNNYKTFKVIYR